ncbi:hypothetical protein [Erythrobacter sp. F6033]|uniref:hypothetical protein n=1 Tax=Erythrobacter sp. F6033 TaxID=2926401 RepID=UPI001FF5DBFB|nr:hypothetical protein [Erythrobacter sp. F6033]MCK0128181.1 hypothetical protein [Erythrobacter sp. F6033]
MEAQASANEPIPVSSDTAEILIVPFDPPLDTPLKYSFVEVSEQTGREPRRVEYEQELTFQKIEDGYLLQLKNIAIVVGEQRIALNKESILREFPPAMAALFSPNLEPVEIELDAFGEPLRLRNWEATRAAIIAQKDFWISQVSPEVAEIYQESFELVFAPIRNSTPEDAAYVAVKGWPYILGFGGLELEEGAEYELDTEMQVGIASSTIDALSLLRLDRDEHRNLYYSESTQADEAQLLIALKNTFDELPGKFQSLQTEEVQEKIEDAKNTLQMAQMIDELDIVFDERSGLPLSAKSTNSLLINAEISRKVSFSIRSVDTK